MSAINQEKYNTEAAKVFQEGDNAWRQGEYQLCRDKYREAVKLYLENDDNEGAAFVYCRLGELELSQYNYDKAEVALLGALNLVETADDADNTKGLILINLSKLRAEQQEYKQALEFIMQAKKVLQRNGSHNLEGEAWEYEAYIYLISGDDNAAIDAYKKAAYLFETEHITLKEATVLRAIARLEMKHKNYDVAHDILEKCRELYRENGDLLGEASCLSAIGSLRYIIRDIPNARKALMKAVYLYGKAGHNFAEAEALLYLARVEAIDQERGSFPRAITHYKHSIELYDFMQNEIMKNAVLEEYHNFLKRIGKED